MDVAWLRSSTSTLNYGAAPTSKSESGNPSSTAVGNTIIRMTSDPHTAGYTQDVCTLFIYYDASTSDPDNDADTLRMHGHVLRRDWGEGDNIAVASDAGEADWVDAIEGTSSWATAGALNTTTDIQAAVACSSIYIVNATASGYLTLEIAGSHLTQDFFDYGIMLRVGWSDATFEVVTWNSDDNATETFRPYFSGYETAPAGGVLSIGGGTTVGGGVVVGGK
jgi:hypothetical protein